MVVEEAFLPPLRIQVGSFCKQKHNIYGFSQKTLSFKLLSDEIVKKIITNNGIKDLLIFR